MSEREVAAGAPRAPSRLSQLAQVILTIALVAFASWYLWRQWQGAATSPVRVHLEIGWLVLATLLVLATYGLLVEVWRRVLMRYGYALGILDAARVWFVSNLGKYVPGKVWQVTTMALMLSRLNIPLGTAAGASAVITIANVVAGFALLLAVGTPSLRLVLGGHEASLLIATLILVVAFLTAPFLMRVLSSLASRMLRKPFDVTMPAAAAWLSVIGCAIAWLLYGTAFQLFVRSLLGSASAPWIAYVTAYTLSYLFGYLALFAPGGIGIREVTLSYLLITLRIATPAEAAVITVASRLWLTVLEIVPGVLFLFVRPAKERATTQTR